MPIITTEMQAKELASELTRLTAFIHIIKEAPPFIATRLLELLIDFFAVLLLYGYITNKDTRAAISLITSSQVILRSVNVMFLYQTSNEVRKVKAKAEEAKEKAGENIQNIDDISKENLRDVGNILKASWLFGTGLSVISIPLAMFSAPFFKLIGESEEVADTAQEYLRAYAIGILFMLWSISNQQIALGMKEPMQVFIITALTRLPVLLMGYYLTAELGVSGMGYANSISYFLAFLVSTWVFRLSKAYKDCDLWGKFSKAIFEILYVLMSYGLKIGVYALVELGSLFFMTAFVGIFGNSFLRAVQPSLQYGSILSVTYALATSMSIMISGALKKGLKHDAQMYGIVGTLICTFIPVLATVLFLSTGNLFLSPFSEDSSIAHTFLLITLLGQIADGLRNACSGVLRGYGDADTAMYTNILSMLLINGPLTCVSAFVLDSPIGVVIARSAAILLSSLVLLAKYAKTVYALEKVVDKEASVNGEKEKTFPTRSWVSFFRNNNIKETTPLLLEPKQRKFSPCIIL